MVFNTNILAGSGGQGEEGFSPKAAFLPNTSAGGLNYLFTSCTANATVSSSSSTLIANTKKASWSYWIYPSQISAANVGFGTHIYPFSAGAVTGNDTNGTQITTQYSFFHRKGDAAGGYDAFMSPPAGSFMFSKAGMSNVFVTNQWNCIQISFNTCVTNVGNVYVNDTHKASVGTATGLFLNTAGASRFYIGASLFGPSGAHAAYRGGLAEYYYAPGQYINFNIESNRRKFINADGTPVDLGADGSTPTGSRPMMYLSLRDGEAATEFATNRGFGSDFTVKTSISILDVAVSAPV
tara:strand:+ start:377 stop:1261 length:885 start_codon:yes stop_codon:yes gene_type:complete